MKKTLFTTSLLLSGLVAAQGVTPEGWDEVPDYTFTTQNGIGDWGAPGSTRPGTTGTGGGDYDEFTFSIHTDSLYAGVPFDTTGSLTEVTTIGGVEVPQEDASRYFEPVDKVSLTSITLFTRSQSDATDVPAGVTLQITDALGNIVTSAVGVYTASQTAYDPWNEYITTGGAWTYPRGTVSFEFTDTAILQLDTEYTVTVVGGELGLFVTLNGDEGFSAGGSAYSPAGMTIVTEALPEPSTATMSLLALAGLLARRRRKTA